MLRLREIRHVYELYGKPIFVYYYCTYMMVIGNGIENT